MKSLLSSFSREIRVFLIGIFLLLLLSAKPIFCQESFYDSNPEEHKKACQGYYSLTMIKKTSSDEQWILRDKDNNIASIDLPEIPSRINLYNCVDIDNDGQKEAIVEYYTLGAHCCFEYHIYRQEEAGLKLFERQYLGNAYAPVFKDINKDGILEMLTFDDSFSYFNGLCYACSPALPLILCYRNKMFSDCTNEFPEIIDHAIEKTLKKKEDHELYRRGLALQYLVLNVIGGKRELGWQGVKKYYPDSYLWLRENARDINKILDGRKFNKR